MILYAALMFLTSALLWAVGALIYRGRTGLIHDYHQENVKPEDRLRYGRAMGAGLLVLAAALLSSGILALCLTEGSKVPLLALFGGIAVSIVLLIRAQR